MNSGFLKKFHYIYIYIKKSNENKRLFETKHFFLPTCTTGKLSVAKLSCNSWNWGLLIVLLIPGNLLLQALSFYTARTVNAGGGKFTTALMASPHGVTPLVLVARSRFTCLIKKETLTNPLEIFHPDHYWAAFLGRFLRDSNLEDDLAH